MYKRQAVTTVVSTGASATGAVDTGALASGSTAGIVATAGSSAGGAAGSAASFGTGACAGASSCAVSGVGASAGAAVSVVAAVGLAAVASPLGEAAMAPASAGNSDSVDVSSTGGASSVFSGSTEVPGASSTLRLASAGGPCTVPTPANGANVVSLPAVGVVVAATSCSGGRTSSKYELSPA